MPDHSHDDESRQDRSHPYGRRRRPAREPFRHGTPPGRHSFLPPLPRAYLTRAGIAAVAVVCLVLGPGIAQSAVRAHDTAARQQRAAPDQHERRTHAATPTRSSAPASTAEARRPATHHHVTKPHRTRTAHPTSASPSHSATRSPSARPTKHRTHKPKPTQTGSGGGSGSVAADVVQRTNTERARNGCGPLAVDSRLTKAAQGHSDDMAAHQYFSHDSQDGRSPFQRMSDAGYRYSAAAENIAAGQPDAASVVESWMNSPGHRLNMMNCAYTEVGIGYATTSQGYHTYWTMDLGRPL